MSDALVLRSEAQAGCDWLMANDGSIDYELCLLLGVDHIALADDGSVSINDFAVPESMLTDDARDAIALARESGHRSCSVKRAIADESLNERFGTCGPERCPELDLLRALLGFAAEADASCVALIACSMTKADCECEARELYRGAVFGLSRSLAELKGWDWFVISAQHGLVEPTAPIAPYDRTLCKMSAAERDAWGAMTAEQIRQSVPAGTTLVLLAGERYAAPLIERLDGEYAIELPLRGLGVGYAKQTLKRMAA
jgi:hypothetical protein